MFDFASAKMVLIEQLWDDVIGGPQPDHGLGRFRKITTQPLNIKGDRERSKFERNLSMPASPSAPTTPVTPTTPGGTKKVDVWRSVFNPGSNLATRGRGGELYDKPLPNSPTVYDWLYSDETRSKHQ